jgi:hypothetical protein
MSTKGDRDRTTDKKAYDACPLWNNWKTKAKNQRIFEENKDKIEGSNVEIVECLSASDGTNPCVKIENCCDNCIDRIMMEQGLGIFDDETKTVEVKGE